MIANAYLQLNDVHAMRSTGRAYAIIVRGNCTIAVASDLFYGAIFDIEAALKDEDSILSVTTNTGEFQIIEKLIMPGLLQSFFVLDAHTLSSEKWREDETGNEIKTSQITTGLVIRRSVNEKVGTVLAVLNGGKYVLYET